MAARHLIWVGEICAILLNKYLVEIVQSRIHNEFCRLIVADDAVFNLRSVPVN